MAEADVGCELNRYSLLFRLLNYFSLGFGFLKVPGRLAFQLVPFFVNWGLGMLNDHRVFDDTLMHQTVEVGHVSLFSQMWSICVCGLLSVPALLRLGVGRETHLMCCSAQQSWLGGDGFVCCPSPIVGRVLGL